MGTLSVIGGGSPPPRDPCPVCIERLEMALAKARSGEMEDVALAYVTRDGVAYTSYSCDTVLLVGATAMLMKRITE